MSSRLGVSVCGAVALVVLVRAAAYYARTDALALALVAAMTVALVAAIAELLLRVGRADRLARELAALPRPATPAAIAGSSDGLRPLLRARIASVAGSVGSAPLAGYIVGLLVMLGLLGTFLGLFETLRGAREALTSSGDVEGLRASLAAPMQGLTRSFGTSAAGVSASAMLGLASALARRTESRFAQALSAYAADALAPLTVQGRQLDALERLVRQGEALPRAVDALEAAAARLASLEGSWTTAHAEASAHASAAIRQAAERVGSDLQRAVERAASAAEEALAPLVIRAVEGSVAAARKHVDDVGALLDADLTARRREEAAHSRAREEALARTTASEDARAQALAALWAETTRALQDAAAAANAQGEARDAAFARAAGEIADAARATLESARERLERADERAAAHAARLGAVVAAIETRGEAAAIVVGEQHAAVDALLSAAATRAAALDEEVRAGHASLVAEVQRGISEHSARAVALEREVGATLAAHSEKLVAALGAHADARAGELATVAASVREAAAGIAGGGAELAAVAEMFAGAVDQHRQGSAEWLAALGTIEGAIARAASEASGGALEEQLDRARELFDTQLQFHRELLLQIRGVHLAAEARRERQDEDAPA